MNKIEMFVSSAQAMHSAAYEPAGPDLEKRVTARIPLATYWQLQAVAEECGYSATSMAESLLCYAVEDAWKAAGFEQQDFDELLRKNGHDVPQLETSWPEPPPSAPADSILSADDFHREEASK